MMGKDMEKNCIICGDSLKILKEFPASRIVQRDCKPVYEEMPGLGGVVRGVKKFEKLPVNARKYIKRLEQLVGAKIDLISLGRKREETIPAGKNVKLF